MPRSTTKEKATEVVSDETVQIPVVESAAEPVTTAAATVAAPEVHMTEETAPVPVDDRVEVYIPRGRENDDPNLFVGINGVNYLLPKGKTHKVPRAVAREITRSLMAQNRQDENSEKLMNAAK